MAYRDLNAVQLRVTLAEIEPLVWRRVVVPASWHLGRLHLVIQAPFNWWNYHLHEYRIVGLRYGHPDIDDGGFEDSPKLLDESDVRLCDFGREPGMTFTYVYDFDDDWQHIVKIEQHLALDPLPKLATCIDGACARPPEDVGGVPGYERFLDVEREMVAGDHSGMHVDRNRQPRPGHRQTVVRIDDKDIDRRVVDLNNVQRAGRSELSWHG